MNRIQLAIQEFHEAFEHPIGDVEHPKIISERVELRKKLIASECKETLDALDAGDLDEIIDGICDLVYVAVGTLVEYGIDFESHFEEVHRTNMNKVGGTKDVDGKTLKPDGWLPPDHKFILECSRRHAEGMRKVRLK